MALFFVPRVLPDGRLNSLSYRRLKDKLGTRSLPTAEMDFNEATAYAIGDPSEGFKTLMNYVINASRMHNAVNACGFLRRAFIEARNYARQRQAFGQPIVNYPLIQETLISLLERLLRQRLLTFKLIALVDRNGMAPEDPAQAMWQRFLTNLAKYRTASTLTASIHDAIMVLGGNGIVEDFSVLPRLLRDAMIIETWEGAHNTLCLQIARDLGKSNLLEKWRAEVNAILSKWPRDLMPRTRRRFDQTFRQTLEEVTTERLADSYWAATNARRLVDRLGDLLELAWMADSWLRRSDEDQTTAVMAALAAHSLLPNLNLFERPAHDALAPEFKPLIDESPVSFALTNL